MEDKTESNYRVRFACTAAQEACKNLAYYATKGDKYFARDLYERCLRLQRDVEVAMKDVTDWLSEVHCIAQEEEAATVKRQRDRIEGEPIDRTIPKGAIF